MYISAKNDYRTSFRFLLQKGKNPSKLIEIRLDLFRDSDDDSINGLKIDNFLKPD